MQALRYQGMFYQIGLRLRSEFKPPKSSETAIDADV